MPEVLVALVNGKGDGHAKPEKTGHLFYEAVVADVVGDVGIVTEDNRVDDRGTGASGAFAFTALSSLKRGHRVG